MPQLDIYILFSALVLFVCFSSGLLAMCFVCECVIVTRDGISSMYYYYVSLLSMLSTSVDVVVLDYYLLCHQSLVMATQRSLQLVFGCFVYRVAEL